MIALTDKIPLRQNTAWGTFGTAEYIPHRYGVVGGKLVQYDRQRLNFVWADHPVESIDQVFVNGLPASDWTWANVKDVVGHPVAMVTFQQPVDIGATPTARGKGKPHPTTGVRMTDPAAILWDVLANVCGRTVTESSLGAFSAACAARGLEASGSIEQADAVMAVAIAICASVGAVYSSAASPAVWPGATPGASLAALDPDLGHTATASAKLVDIANDLTIRYDFEAGSPRQSLQLEAPDSVTRFGRRPLVIDAIWISSPRTAYDVAKRLLEQRARPQWAVHADTIKRALRIGQYVSVNHPVIPATGAHIVLGTEYTFSTALTAIDLAIPVGSVPATRIVQQSEAFDPQTYAAIGLQTIGNDRVLTLTNIDGTPIINASVTLDGTITRFSDSSGRVAFPAVDMPPGQHQLLILTQDGRTLQSSVLVQ